MEHGQLYLWAHSSRFVKIWMSRDCVWWDSSGGAPAQPLKSLCGKAAEQNSLKSPRCELQKDSAPAAAWCEPDKESLETEWRTAQIILGKVSILNQEITWNKNPTDGNKCSVNCYFFSGSDSIISSQWVAIGNSWRTAWVKCFLLS